MSEPASDPDFPDWHPDLSGPHLQPNGGPNGTAFSIAIGRPGIETDNKERQRIELYQRELADAYQSIIPDDERHEKIQGPPHHDPIHGSFFPRKFGMTETGWEAWLDDSRFF
jgi:hypothetical protein